MEMSWFHSFSPTTFVLVVIVIVLLYLYSTWTFSTFKNMGVRGPTPWPFIGSMLEYRKGMVIKDLEWSKKYGKVFGIYEGRSPMLLVTDPEMCKQICVKHFSSFRNRKAIPLRSKPMSSGLFQLADSRWKVTRNTLIPSFSGSKMRLMSPLISRCADELIKNMEAHCKEGKTVQCKELFGGYVVDSIASVGFGMDVSSQTQPEHPFVEHAKVAFTFGVFSPAFAIVFFFPFLVPLLNYFEIPLLPKKTVDYFAQVVEEAIKLRKSDECASQRVDFLQLMINAHDVYDEYVKNKEDEEDRDEGVNRVEFIKDGAHSPVNLSKGLSKDEMLAQSIVFFIAGYETTNTTMSFVCYNLATNPETQVKLQREIDEVMRNYDDVGYEAVSKMKYLDMVVSETLRIFPPPSRFNRECNQDVNINGINIPKGMTVSVSPYVIHHDPDNYPDPEKFIPERFTKEEKEKRHPYAWIPFGAGPRNCIGMRFALIEAKIGLVRVLQKFTFEPCAETEIPPVFGKQLILSPPNGIKLSVKLRA
ncbi:cytochrome P450 3A24-like [Saccoglossus kowalevskii]|uniref:Cytochrome P450 3A24-like n=1 Tax=Saccoglossus kowalevskii TaxID=10224 RepID=A0ABM0GK41_SACKO|nr:PREDICTED: cytochrome P450 3A24-like [Saccoglossus kowalevskii]